jgi:hypothetical protein
MVSTIKQNYFNQLVTIDSLINGSNPIHLRGKRRRIDEKKTLRSNCKTKMKKYCRYFSYFELVLKYWARTCQFLCEQLTGWRFHSKVTELGFCLEPASAPQRLCESNYGVPARLPLYKHHVAQAVAFIVLQRFSASVLQPQSSPL